VSDSADETPERRWFPARVGGIFYLLTIAAALVGLAIVAAGAWRNGVRLLAVGLLLAAVLRVILPEEKSGMLAVRHRYLDAFLLTGVGATMLFLASSIPPQPG